MTVSQLDRKKKRSIKDLIEKGVDVKVCAFCNQPMRLRDDYYENVPGYLMFINEPMEIYKILHRVCKPKYIAKLLKKRR